MQDWKALEIRMSKTIKEAHTSYGNLGRLCEYLQNIADEHDQIRLSGSIYYDQIELDSLFEHSQRVGRSNKENVTKLALDYKLEELIELRPLRHQIMQQHEELRYLANLNEETIWGCYKDVIPLAIEGNYSNWGSLDTKCKDVLIQFIMKAMVEMKKEREIKEEERRRATQKEEGEDIYARREHLAKTQLDILKFESEINRIKSQLGEIKRVVQQ